MAKRAIRSKVKAPATLRARHAGRTVSKGGEARKARHRPKYSGSPGDFRDMLAEEAAEIVKERFKMLRFGHQPGGKLSGYDGPAPNELFHKEIGDFLAVLEHAIDAGFVDWFALDKAIEAKHLRLYELFGLERPHHFIFVE